MRKYNILFYGFHSTSITAKSPVILDNLTPFSENNVCSTSFGDDVAETLQSYSKYGHVIFQEGKNVFPFKCQFKYYSSYNMQN